MSEMPASGTRMGAQQAGTDPTLLRALDIGDTTSTSYYWSTLSKARDAVCSQIFCGQRNPSLFQFECFFTLGSAVPSSTRVELKSEKILIRPTQTFSNERTWEYFRLGYS